MNFKIKANDAIFEWRKYKLHCDKEDVMKHLIQELIFHEPTLLAMPDLIDYDDNLEDGPNAYDAILGTYPDHEIIVDIDKKYKYEFDPNVIY